MKRLLVILFTLCAATAHAATATYNFENAHNPPPDFPPCAFINSLTSNGITATFGQAFSYSQSLDASTTKYCNTFWWDSGVPGRFKNAPSGTWAADLTSYDCYDGGDFQQRMITFSTPIRFFSCWISGVTEGNAWSCYPYILSADNGATWNTHVSGGTLGDYSVGNATIEMWSIPDGAHIKAQIHPQAASGWAGCGPEYPAHPNICCQNTFHWDNTTTPMCNWQYVELVSPVPVSYVYFRGVSLGGFNPLYVDNVTAATGECPNPPCNFERAERARSEAPVVAADAPRAEGSVVMLNTETGERTLRRAHRDGIMYVTPSRNTTWGQLKIRYR